jgi:competence protein ComEC
MSPPASGENEVNGTGAGALLGSDPRSPAGRPPGGTVRFLARPLLWGFAAAALGVMVADLPAMGPRVWAGMGLLALVAAMAVALARAAADRLAPLPFLLGCAALAGSGARAAATLPRGDVGALVGRHAHVIGVVVSEPEALPAEREPRWRFLLRAERARTASGWRPVSGRLAVTAGQPPAYGQRLVVSGLPRAPRPRSNPGGFDARAYWRSRRVFATLSLRERGWRALGPPGGAEPPGWAMRLRHRLGDANRRSLSPLGGYLANSMILGDATPAGTPDRDGLERAFRDSGTMHLLVVSGTQVSLVLLPIFWVCRRHLWLRRGAALLAIPACIGYALVTGGEPSIVRAAVTGAVLALALSCWRDPDFLNLWGFAGLCLLAIEPLSLHNVGCLLSFAAVWGVARLGPVIDELLRRLAPLARRDTAGRRNAGWRGFAWLLRWTTLIIAASVGAYLATAPLLAGWFQTGTPIGLVANIPAVPIAALLLAASWFHAAWALVAIPPPWLAGSVDSLAGSLVRCVEWFAAVPRGHGHVFPPPALVAGATWLILVLAAAWGPRRLAAALVGTGAAAALLLCGERWPAAPPGRLEVTFLDVGQGDCTVIRLPHGQTVLIDGGGQPQSRYDVGETVVAPALRALRIPRLDLVVATHPHDDHIGGLPAVVEQFPISRFWDSGQAAGSPTQRRLLLALKRRSVPFRVVQSGERLDLGGATLAVLGPARPRLAGTRSDLNSNSVVLRLGVGGRHILLPGDAEEPSEARLLAAGLDLRAEVLKLGHHGSDHSTSAAWLRAVRPRVAIACCGVDNRFGHPGQQTLARLGAAGVRVYRTDRDGAITLAFEPAGLEAAATIGPARHGTGR